MARAAVKAKQQARAQAQVAKPSRARGRRRHSGGGNPNQDLFFTKLRRRQKWVYAALAIVFALTFVGVGVGSGSGGLDQLYSGIFGGGGDAVAKAKDEIKNNPAKGYRDLATAYESNGHPALAIAALQSYLQRRKKDANGWSELGGLQLTQAQTYANRYQAAQRASQLADPSQPFLPSGTLGQAIGTNPAYQGASQQASSKTSQYFQQATTALNSAVSDYQQPTKIQPRNPTGWQQLATAAESAGNYKVALSGWQKYLKLDPNAPLRKQIEKRITQLQKVVSSSSSAASSSSSASSSTPSYGQK